jgi:hypothetical protein
MYLDINQPAQLANYRAAPLHRDNQTKPKVCTYTYLCGVQGLGSKHHFSVDKFSEIWISDNQGIYPSRLFYPSSSKPNKGTVIIIRNYGATQIYELPCRKL